MLYVKFFSRESFIRLCLGMCSSILLIKFLLTPLHNIEDFIKTHELQIAQFIKKRDRDLKNVFVSLRLWDEVI